MALTKIGTSGIKDDAVTSDKVANAINSAIAANTAKTSLENESVTLAKLEHGTSSNNGKFLRANNGADPTFETVDLTALSASNLTSGTVPDGRISASSVQQHASSFDDNKIINDISALALKINGIQNATRYNTNSTSVETFQDANGIAALSGMARDATGEYIASVIQNYGTDQYWSTTDLDANHVFALTGTPFTASMMVDGVLGHIGDGTNAAGYIPDPSGFTTGFGYELGADSDFGVGFKFTGARFYNYNTYGRLKNFKAYIEPSSGDGFGSALDIATDGGGETVVDDTTLRAANDNNFNGFVLDTPYVVSSNTTRFVFKFAGLYNNGNVNSGFGEIHIKGQKLTSTVNNATGNFTSNVITASASTTSMGAVITYKDNVGTATLNTDLKLYLSADGGSNYTEVTLVAQPDFSTGVKMAKANDVTVTAGTQLKYKVVVANQAPSTKVTQITGVSMQY